MYAHDWFMLIYEYHISTWISHGHSWANTILWASLVALVLKNLPANAEDMRCGFDPWIRKIPWRRTWQPAPVFLPEESLWTEEPGVLQSIGLQRVRHDWSNLACTQYYKAVILQLKKNDKKQLSGRTGNKTGVLALNNGCSFKVDIWNQAQNWDPGIEMELHCPE